MGEVELDLLISEKWFSRLICLKLDFRWVLLDICSQDHSCDPPASEELLLFCMDLVPFQSLDFFLIQGPQESPLLRQPFPNICYPKMYLARN